MVPEQAVLLASRLPDAVALHDVHDTLHAATMSRILLAALGLLVIPLLLALATAIRGALARFVRALLLLIIAVVGLIGLGTGITGLEKDQYAVFVVGVAIALLCVGFGFALSRGWRRPLRAKPGIARAIAGPPIAEPNSAWTEFEAGLDWVARKQVSRSRAAIDSFLTERGSSALTPVHRALLLSCENRVPQMIETCVARCRQATARERNRYIDETIARLGQIADEAEQARREVRAADDQQLEVLHRYFDEVAPRKDGQRGEL